MLVALLILLALVTPEPAASVASRAGAMPINAPVAILVWSGFMRAAALSVPTTAPRIQRKLAATCPLGCIEVASRARYQVTKDDIRWLAKVLLHESGPRFRRAEAGATAWALVQGWARYRMRRGWVGHSLAGYVQRYSAACSTTWATGGTRWSARITPRADRCRAMGWLEIPKVWVRFVGEFFNGLVPNRWPGVVHVLARGFERYAADDLIGPAYATTEEDHPSGNAYYVSPDTADWMAGTVRIVHATGD